MGVIRELSDYSKAVLDGRIVACKKHKWACLRFLDDLGARGREGRRWDFDEKRAERYFSWMRLFRHSTGELAGQIKEPMAYELFVYGNIYGWIDAEDESRRFRRMYEQLARKQAKSQDKAIQALYEISAFGEPRAEAYVAATKKSQTMYVWAEAERLYRDSIFRESFECKFDQGFLQKTIRHKKSGSVFARMSKDDGKNGDGSNPHFGILDEYHLHETTEYYDVLTSGMKTRKNPLLSIITTAGFELNNPCYRVEYDYVSKILDPDNPIDNERYFVMVCELDRNDTPDTVVTLDGRQVEPGGIIDELGSDEAIAKSSPVTGASKRVREKILEDTEEAKDKPDKMRDVLTKTYNVWVQSRPLGYMDMTRWGACSRPWIEVLDVIQSKAGGKCYIGFDLSAKIDLTSVSFVFPWLEEGTLNYAVLSHSFIPGDKYREKLGSDRVPYDVWSKEGHLTITEGAVVDYRRVIEYVLAKCIAHRWVGVEFCLDPWGSTSVSTDLQNENKKVIEIIQGIKTLGEPTKAFREAVYARRLLHDGNPVLTWAVGNAVTRSDHNGNIMLDKSKARHRIDPVAATITAFTRAMVVPPPKPKRHGPRFF